MYSHLITLFTNQCQFCLSKTAYALSQIMTVVFSRKYSTAVKNNYVVMSQFASLWILTINQGETVSNSPATN